MIINVKFVMQELMYVPYAITIIGLNLMTDVNLANKTTACYAMLTEISVQSVVVVKELILHQESVWIVWTQTV